MKAAAIVLLAVLCAACAPERKPANDYAPRGTWAGLSPSAPPEAPVKRREPRRWGRSAIAVHGVVQLDVR